MKNTKESKPFMSVLNRLPFEFQLQLFPRSAPQGPLAHTAKRRQRANHRRQTSEGFLRKSLM